MTAPEDSRDRLVDRLAGRIDDRRVLEAIGTVPRHEFVPQEQRTSAYADRPLPIGEGQTISAPHMVAIMTALLDLDRGERVLEIGTGCGYHAAVVAELVGPSNLFSVEYEPDLAAAARDRLDRLGYPIDVRVGDGHRGWDDHAPYDAAYLTCAAPERIPPVVVEQVRSGGRLVAPVGTDRQRLVRAWKRRGGELDEEHHGGVRFVPLRGGD